MAGPAIGVGAEDFLPTVAIPADRSHGAVDLYRYEAGASFIYCATCSTGTPPEAAVICLPVFPVSSPPARRTHLVVYGIAP